MPSSSSTNTLTWGTCRDSPAWERGGGKERWRVKNTDNCRHDVSHWLRFLHEEIADTQVHRSPVNFDLNEYDIWRSSTDNHCVMGESVFQSSYRGWVRIFSREQQWHWWTMQKFIQTIITVLRFQLKRLNLARSQISKLAYSTKFKDWLLGICRDKCQQRKVRLRLLKFLIFIE